jgi:hypothetical protein
VFVNYELLVEMVALGGIECRDLVAGADQKDHAMRFVGLRSAISNPAAAGKRTASPTSGEARATSHAVISAGRTSGSTPVPEVPRRLPARPSRERPLTQRRVAHAFAQSFASPCRSAVRAGTETNLSADTGSDPVLAPMHR